jgi:hypothetical protein
MRLSRPITTWATASIQSLGVSADAAIEQIDLFRHLREQAIKRLVEDLEPRHFRVAQVDHDAGAIGGLKIRALRSVSRKLIGRGACALHVVGFDV